MWQKILRNNFTCWKKLASFLELDSAQAEKLIKTPKFSLNLPLRLAEKIEKKRIDDPILLQFVPLTQELSYPPSFSCNPVNDVEAKRTPKLLYKYSHRALLLCTSACPMHCRFCFRRNFPYEKSQGFEEELAYLEKDTSIKEIILSGGDPLSLSDTRLRFLLDHLNGMTHIRRIRFHTRFPIGIPERIDTNFISILAKSHLQIWFIIHCNHPRELDSDVTSALKKILQLGIPVLSQTVLLKGINDSSETLQTLFEQLVDHGISPYYLHQLDRVAGASHFEVSESQGKQLMLELEKQLSGYALPRYAREKSGHTSKLIIY